MVDFVRGFCCGGQVYRVREVRAFNRLYTRVIGVLDEGPVDAEYSLSESRVLFELARREWTEVGELRRVLGLDAGYASRLLGRLGERGLVHRERSGEDARRQVVRLTERGREVFALLDQRSSEKIGELLARFGEQRQVELLGAMATISRIVGGEPDSTVVLRAPRAGDLGWVVHRHGALYTREYGWNDQFEALVARVVADYLAHRDPVREAAWIAELNGERVGSIVCARGGDEQTAKLRLLLVEPSARGHGVGGRLVSECVSFAKSVGYTAMELWTVSLLGSARRIYEAAGFELVDEQPTSDFGPELTGQTWRLKL
ncbi:bifunctional helix-turn-helix transcriptional regulator/GNAT family N-acetyltransferase [Amycolatopsis sp. 195334CR]|uniref:bifunctional helix-turn-helix transcriptional regulator/GNAT family N-acetyltransferase n=1 Tax=Amycolatopsis sp. 195334CR TaxID=2814588 RepID=UPI001A8D7DCC|nr:bifunctional helix-turn-helix transcriptional regulator/GNAT family N-acetyltransferase [Amycolatopsis sp. 195334CR]MBN6035725.1 MarR family transcriptional regulator [Amycolatopsis sp. 195334CR]